MRRLHRLVSVLLTAAWKLRARGSHSDLPNLLRSLLRRFPYWSQGHLAFAEDALSRDAVGEAYAAANAALSLSGSDPARRAATEFTLGRCFLRRGDWRSALEYLDRVKTAMPRNHSVTEELAAALILAGDYSAAQGLLESIPGSQISAAGKAALGFTRAKSASAS